MEQEQNPFIIIGKIKPEYFCDRVEESARIIRSVENGNNLVLISPRRMGKTGLIQFCYEEPQISNKYFTFFIDILHTSSLREFTFLLGHEIFRTLLPAGQKVLQTFMQTLKSLNGSFGFDVQTGLPTFNIALGDISQPEYTLEEIFSYLSHTEKPCIVAIDEFQQINRYPEKNIEALLRTYIQKMGNTHFVFAGSERHIMQEMFTSNARPFYRSADILELKAIEKDVYVPWIVNHFVSNQREIDENDVVWIYELFKGHTYYIQKVFNEAFADTPRGEICTREMLQNAIDRILDSTDTIYREILSNIPEKQKELLYAIARADEAERVTSSEFVKRHKLTSASSVQSAVNKLLEKDIITQINKTFSLTDKFFAMWIRRLGL